MNTTTPAGDRVSRTVRGERLKIMRHLGTLRREDYSVHIPLHHGINVVSYRLPDHMRTRDTQVRGHIAVPSF